MIHSYPFSARSTLLVLIGFSVLSPLLAQRYDYAVGYTTESAFESYFADQQSNTNWPLATPLTFSSSWSIPSAQNSTGSTYFLGTYNTFTLATAADLTYSGISAANYANNAIVSLDLNDFVTLVGPGSDPVELTVRAEVTFSPQATSTTTNRLTYSFNLNGGGFAGTWNAGSALTSDFFGNADPVSGTILLTPGVGKLLSLDLRLTSASAAGRYNNGDYYDSGGSDLDATFAFYVDLPEEYSLMSAAGFNYGALSAVPEPSTYAAIFGALALGGAVWRRRRVATLNRTAA